MTDRRTDGRADGQTSFHGIVRAMHTRRAVKIKHSVWNVFLNSVAVVTCTSVPFLGLVFVCFYNAVIALYCFIVHCVCTCVVLHIFVFTCCQYFLHILWLPSGVTNDFYDD